MDYPRQRRTMRNAVKAILILLIFAVGCQSSSGGHEGGWSDATSDTIPASIENPTGFAEAGPFQGYSEVTMWPLDIGYSQVGSPYVGDTEADDSGRFTIYAEIKTADVPYVKTKVSGAAYNETSDITDTDVAMESTIPTSAGSFNANYATSIASIVGNYWYHDDIGGPYYKNSDAYKVAETAVLDYFDYSGLWEPETKKTYEMTLTGDTLDDGKLVLINATIALGKTGPAQGNFMREIAEDIYTGANANKAEVNSITEGLLLKTIKDNLDGYYSSRGLDYDCAPAWLLPGVETYYRELLSSEPTVIKQYNMDTTSTCAYSGTPAKMFAVPVRFVTQAVEDANYIAAEFSEGDLSFWTSVPDGDYLKPGTKISDVTEFREVLLTEPQKLRYNGSMGDHGLTMGRYYAVIRKNEFFNLEKACDGATIDGLTVGKGLSVLVSHDDGVTWVGNDLVGNAFANTEMQFYITD